MNEVATVETPSNSEADTMKLIEGFTAVFNRARDSIIDASRLAREVAEVRQELEAIKREMEELRRQNAALDDQLAHVRQQRDEALAESGEWRRKHEELTRSHENFKATAEAQLVSANQTNETLQNAHNEVLQELDTARVRIAERERELDSAHQELERVKARSAKMEEQIKSLHSLIAPPEVEQVEAPKPAFGSSW